VEDWTSGAPGTRTAMSTGENSAPHFNWRQKLQIIARAWRWFGWHAARHAVARETTLIRELSRERALGFQLIKGVKWPQPSAT
jgi:hypothetical protein